MKKVKGTGLRVLFGSLFVIILLFLFYFKYYFHYFYYGGSDNVFGFLAAQDVLNGNILLKDWFLSTNNFASTIMYELLWLKIFGFKLFTFEFSSIIAYIVFLFFGCKCCSSSIEDNRSRKYFYLFFLLLMVLPPGVITNSTSWEFLMPFMRIEAYITYFIILLILNIMESKRTGPLYFWFAIFIFIGAFSDDIMIFILILPVIFAYLLQYFITKKYYILKILIILLASFFLAKLAQKFIMPSPGAGLLNVSFVRNNQLFSNLFRIIEELMMFYDSSFLGVKIVSYNGIRSIVGLLVFISIVTIFIKALKKIAIMPFIDQILLLSAIIQFVSYSLSNKGDVSASRYLIPVVINLNLLFSRNILKISDFSIGGLVIHNKILLKVIIFLLVLSNLFKLTDPINMSKKEKDIFSYRRENEIVKCLEYHGLEKGYAGYWNSHMLTALSEGKVSVAPIVYTGKFFTQYQYMSKDQDYLQDRRFVISPQKKENKVDYGGGLTYKNIIEIFGQPIKEIEIEDVLILVYDKNLSLEVKSRQRQIYKYGELPFKNAKIENDSLAIMKTGVQYGPYVTLGKGSYHVKIEGKNLLEAYVSMKINGGKEELTSRSIQQKENCLEYILEIKKTVKDFEVVVSNNSDTVVGVKDMVIEKIQNSAKEKITNNKKIIKEGQI